MPYELDGRVVTAELDGRAVNRSPLPSCLQPGHREVDTLQGMAELDGSSDQRFRGELPELQGREVYRAASYHGSALSVDNSSMDTHCSAE